jgi:integrase
MAKITKRVVTALHPDPGGKDVFIWDAGDGAIKGFGIRMKPSGTASYLAQYRNKEGRTRRLVLGKVGVLTPDEARTLAGDALRAATKGGDPSADRHAVRGAMTVSELCDRYVAEARSRIKASTLKADKGRIEAHVKPLLGNLSVRSLTTSDIERMKNDIISGRTAKPRKPGRGGITRGGLSAAARTIGMVGTILEYARRSLKLIKENPQRGIKKPPDKKQSRYLSLSEIATLGAEMRRAETSKITPTALAAIRLLLLTGLRREEALGLPKPWIDINAQCLRLGDSKTGPQVRPIGIAAVKLIKDQLPLSEGPWVFPAARGNKWFVGLPKVLERVCAKAGLHGVTLHVLRHTFASVAAQEGYSELTIAGMLGHKTAGITARYSHLPDRALVSAADFVSNKIAATLDATL